MNTQAAFTEKKLRGIIREELDRYFLNEQSSPTRRRFFRSTKKGRAQGETSFIVQGGQDALNEIGPISREDYDYYESL